MTTRVLRWNVPVDDDEHKIGNGPVVHVAARDNGLGGHRSHDVEVWTIESDLPNGVPGPMTRDRTVRVIGTGHPIPAGFAPIGSTFDAYTDRLVWHVFEKLF